MDHIILKWFQNHQTEFFNSLMVDISYLASPLSLIIPIILTINYLKDFKKSIWMIAVVGFTVFCTFEVKEIVGRCRPLVWHIVIPAPNDGSFPSGHSTMSMCVFLILATTWDRRLIPYSILLSILIGISRLYLGVHWFTDVISGWLIGITSWWLWLQGYKKLNKG